MCFYYLIKHAYIYIYIYRDDGIIFILNSNGLNTSKIQKKIIRAFNLLGLLIEIVSNLETVDFIDVTFNLNNGTFKPFSKSNSTPTYINIDSNHPRSILKQIPNAVYPRVKKKIWGEQKDIWWNPQK